MLRRLLLASALLVAACSGKKTVPSPAPAADAAPAAAPDAAPAAAAQPAPPSKEARRAYRKHLAAGRKLGAKKAWGEAVVELEAALAAIPHDGRALSELAWAAYNAGDHDKARRAGMESVLAASDAKVKASALYNLGRVEETLAHKEQAAKLYRQSLALRENKTVAEHLAGLGQDAAAPEDGADDTLPCSEARPAEQVCACIDAFASYWDKDMPAEERSCTLEPEGSVAGLRVATAKMSFDTETILLVAKGANGWSVVAHLEDVFNPGAFGIFEEWKLTSLRADSIGEGRTIIRVVTEHHRRDSDSGLAEMETEDTTRLTLCVGSAGVTTCPLQAVPMKYAFLRERLDFGDDEELDEETKKMQTPGLPIRDSFELNVQVKNDGTATVVLSKGSVGKDVKALLGPHRLF